MSYQKILPDDPEDPNLYAKQGKLYQESGNFEAAITCYENAIRITCSEHAQNLSRTRCSAQLEYLNT